MILQNDFKQQWEVVEESVLGAVGRVGRSGWYILGEEVDAFEKALAEAWGVSQAVGTGNGLDALEIGLRCLDLQPGERVLTTPALRLRHDSRHRSRGRGASVCRCG